MQAPTSPHDHRFADLNRGGQTLTLDAGTVDARLGGLAVDEDLSRYIHWRAGARRRRASGGAGWSGGQNSAMRSWPRTAPAGYSALCTLT